jgi:hypothetical protein
MKYAKLEKMVHMQSDFHCSLPIVAKTIAFSKQKNLLELDDLIGKSTTKKN